MNWAIEKLQSVHVRGDEEATNSNVMNNISLWEVRGQYSSQISEGGGARGHFSGVYAR